MTFLNSVWASFTGLFLTPFFFWFLWLLPVVVLLYLLKLRRTQVVISSTLLWRKSLQDLTANAPFQRLRKNLLLFLQLLVLLLLVVGLVRPFVRTQGATGQNLCLLIDCSASMQTREGEATRLDLAKEQAVNLVNEMKRGDKIMVVTFGHGSEVACELSDDRLRLRRAIRALDASDTQTSIRDALLVAQSLKLQNADLRLIILSDGNIADLRDLATRIADVAFVTFSQVGQTTDNAGITAFSLRKPQENSQGQQTFTLVHNEHTEPLETTLSLYLNDELLAVQELSVGPGEDREVLFTHPELGQGILRAELDHQDDLAVDNAAWLALRPPAGVRVLLVAEPDAVSAYFLKRVLALDPRVELSMIAPNQYTPTDEYDLTVFDGVAPETLPAGATLFFNVLPKIEGLAAEGEIPNPPVLAVEPDHPVTRFLNPGNVGIAKAIKVRLPEGSRVLMSTTGGPLVADISRGGRQMLIVTFDLGDSDWPLNLSFPLFIQNVLAWTPRATMAGEPSVPAGRPLPILPCAEAELATVTRPDGASEPIRLDATRPVFYAATGKVGIYKVTRGAETDQYAVNLVDATESAITPAEALHLGRTEVEAERGPVKQNREFWRWLVAGGLLVLCVEWWIYSRRAWM